MNIIEGIVKLKWGRALGEDSDTPSPRTVLGRLKTIADRVSNLGFTSIVKEEVGDAVSAIGSAYSWESTIGKAGENWEAALVAVNWKWSGTATGKIFIHFVHATSGKAFLIYQSDLVSNAGEMVLNEKFLIPGNFIRISSDAISGESVTISSLLTGRKF